MHHILEQLVEL
jgi:hypothetical protein